MRKPCTFEELPEQLRTEITAQSNFNVEQGEKAYQAIKCASNENGDSARCFVSDDCTFGIFDLYRDRLTVTWIGSHEVKVLYEQLGEIWKDKTIAESTRP